MRRWLGWIAIAWLMAICVVAVAAYGNVQAGSSLAARTRDLASQLRCPACQGETVADSQAQIAIAIRALISQRLAAGQSPDQIKNYLVSRFGDRILLAPPQSGIDWVAWLAPPLLLLGGIGLLLTLVIDWRRRGKVRPESARSDYVDRVREEVLGKS
jgi:cytochrome c-type biogenesis protein CcmH